MTGLALYDPGYPDGGYYDLKKRSGLFHDHHAAGAALTAREQLIVGLSPEAPNGSSNGSRWIPAWAVLDSPIERPDVHPEVLRGVRYLLTRAGERLELNV